MSFVRVCLEGKKTGGYEFVLQEGGVHDDPYFDLFLGTLGEGEVGGLAHKIVEWLVGLALLKMVESSGVMVFLVNVHLYNTWSLMDPYHLSVQITKSITSNEYKWLTSISVTQTEVVW